MRYLRYSLIMMMAGMFTLVSCDHDPDLPFPLHETFDNTGAFLRIVEVTSAGFDVVDLENARFAFVGEVDDIEDGDTIDNVEFFVKYVSLDGDESEEVHVKTYDIADMSRDEDSGLYREEFEITANEAMDVIDGFGVDDLLIGDRIEVRWQLNLHDGRSFTRGDASGDITGGGFYNSPYFRRANVVAAIPEDKFVGTYQFTQTNDGSLASVSWGVPQVFDELEFEAELRIDPDNDLNGRVFDAAYLGAFGVEPHPNSIVIALANEPENNAVTLAGSFNSGLSCGGPPLEIAPESEQISQFDFDDDSEFTMVIYDNPNGACGGDPVDVIFEVEKID